VVSRNAVTAVLVTRGDVDLAAILEPLGDLDRVVYDNGAGTVTVLPPGYLPEPTERIWHQPDLSVYGRYAALVYVKTRLVLVQDDDCVLPPESIAALLDAWQPGHVVCNMPERFRAHYSDSALVGFGAVFERDLPAKAFDRFRSFPFPATVNGRDVGTTYLTIPDSGQAGFACREADTIFTTLTPRILVDVPKTDLPHATAPDRLYRQPEHHGARKRMLDLARQVRDGSTASSSPLDRSGRRL